MLGDRIRQDNYNSIIYPRTAEMRIVLMRWKFHFIPKVLRDTDFRHAFCEVLSLGRNSGNALRRKVPYCLKVGLE